MDNNLFVRREEYNPYKIFAEKLKNQDARVLTKEEEYEMLNKIKENPENKELRDEFIYHNIRLVLNFVKKYQEANTNKKADSVDLIQEGYIGLNKAIDKFDLSSGNKFSTYATFWIRQCVQRYEFEKCDMIRIPNHLHELDRKISKLCKDFVAQNGRKPNYKEMSEIFKEKGYNYSSRKIEDYYILKNSVDTESLDRSVENKNDFDSYRTYVLELVKDNNDENRPEKVILANDAKDELLKSLETLKPRNRKIIELRYGLDGKGSRSYEEIGEIFGITKERARQVEKRCLKKLREVSTLQMYKLYPESKEEIFIQWLNEIDNVEKYQLESKKFLDGISYLEFYLLSKENIKQELHNRKNQEALSKVYEILEQLENDEEINKVKPKIRRQRMKI